jgi:hypothetical protein
MENMVLGGLGKKVKGMMPPAKSPTVIKKKEMTAARVMLLNFRVQFSAGK